MKINPQKREIRPRLVSGNDLFRLPSIQEADDSPDLTFNLCSRRALALLMQIPRFVCLEDSALFLLFSRHWKEPECTYNRPREEGVYKAAALRLKVGDYIV